MSPGSLQTIVHFGKFYFPEIGGIEAVTQSVAEGAVKAGHIVSVVCFKANNTNIPMEKINGVNVIRAKKLFNIASQPLSFDYFCLALREARKATIVHLHAPNILASLCSLLLHKDSRLVVHWHSDIRNKGILGYFSRPLERLCLKRADTIVVTSEIYGRTSKSLASFQSKLRIVPIGVPDPSFEKPNFVLSNLLKFNYWEEILSDRRLILSVGRLVSFKGFEVLIEAAAQLPKDVVVVIVGDGPLKSSLQAKIDTAGVGNKVYLTGSLPRAQEGGTLHRLFKRADLYCLPSIDRSESFGVVLIEAMAYATPCLVSDIHGSGVSWVNKIGVSGATFSVGDASGLAHQAMRILNDTYELARLGQGARDRYLTLFTEAASTNRMLDVYADLGLRSSENHRSP